jgi:hypothetical protein
MKTLSRTFVFILAAVVAVVAVLSFRAVAAGSDQHASQNKMFMLNIGGGTPTSYAPVKSTTTEKDVKDAVKPFHERGVCNIEFKRNDGTVFDPCAALSIKTDKVTTSEVAKNASAGGSVANDPNVTRLLSSDTAADFKAVLDLFP